MNKKIILANKYCKDLKEKLNTIRELFCLFIENNISKNWKKITEIISRNPELFSQFLPKGSEIEIYEHDNNQFIYKSDEISHGGLINCYSCTDRPEDIKYQNINLTSKKISKGKTATSNTYTVMPPRYLEKIRNTLGKAPAFLMALQNIRQQYDLYFKEENSNKIYKLTENFGIQADNNWKKEEWKDNNWKVDNDNAPLFYYTENDITRAKMEFTSNRDKFHEVLDPTKIFRLLKSGKVSNRNSELKPYELLERFKNLCFNLPVFRPIQIRNKDIFFSSKKLFEIEGQRQKALLAAAALTRLYFEYVKYFNERTHIGSGKSIKINEKLYFRLFINGLFHNIKPLISKIMDVEKSDIDDCYLCNTGKSRFVDLCCNKLFLLDPKASGGINFEVDDSVKESILKMFKIQKLSSSRWEKIISIIKKIYKPEEPGLFLMCVTLLNGETKKETKIVLNYSTMDLETMYKIEELFSDYIMTPSSIEIIKAGEINKQLANLCNNPDNRPEYFIVILSRNYINCFWRYPELQKFFTGKVEELCGENIHALLLEKCQIPPFFQDKIINQDELFLEDKVKQLKELYAHGTTLNTLEKKKIIYKIYQKNLNNAYRGGYLTLFCGAGLSVGAGVKNWDDLILALMQMVHTETDITKELYKAYYEVPNYLIIAQYLKKRLGAEFKYKLREIIYDSISESSPTIDTIVNLCIKGKLSSIITFNFDDLLEYNLHKNNILCRSIYKEGQHALPNGINIYHPHGFIPRFGNLDENNEPVLSEDFYHDQYMDPFQWSNTIQFNHFTNSTFLIIGFSLTDPNQRRILDICMRKKEDNVPKHYIIYRKCDWKKNIRLNILNMEQKKHYKNNDKENYSAFDCTERIKDIFQKYRDDKLDVFQDDQHLAFEEDLNRLGLNVIWINDFDEIPQIVDDVSNAEPKYKPEKENSDG